VFLGTQDGTFEYIGGLTSCNPTVLNPMITSAIVLDSNDNLIVSDLVTSAVEVLDPPYATVSKTIASGIGLP
jgi:hypothetical protein